MANTYHQIYMHTVFAVKYRKAIIDKSWQQELFSIIGNLINESNSKTIIVNGVEDHVHCFFGMKPSTSVSEVMKNVYLKIWLCEMIRAYSTGIIIFSFCNGLKSLVRIWDEPNGSLYIINNLNS